MLKTLSVAALVAVVAAAPAHAATQITVANIGSVLNESLALPAEDTPGSGIGFLRRSVGDQRVLRCPLRQEAHHV